MNIHPILVHFPIALLTIEIHFQRKLKPAALGWMSKSKLLIPKLLSLWAGLAWVNLLKE
jgi:uncharacterized membrane protein